MHNVSSRHLIRSCGRAIRISRNRASPIVIGRRLCTTFRAARTALWSSSDAGRQASKEASRATCGQWAWQPALSTGCACHCSRMSSHNAACTEPRIVPAMSGSVLEVGGEAGRRFRSHTGRSGPELAIFEATERLLQTKSLHEISVAQILCEAGVSRAGVLLLFRLQA